MGWNIDVSWNNKISEYNNSKKKKKRWHVE